MINRNKALRLYKKGFDLVEVGAKLDCSPETVRKYLMESRELRRTGRPGGLTPEEAKVAVQAYLDGASGKEVAARFKISHETVRRYIRLSGNKIRSPSEAMRLVFQRKQDVCRGHEPLPHKAPSTKT